MQLRIKHPDGTIEWRLVQDGMRLYFGSHPDTDIHVEGLGILPLHFAVIGKDGKFKFAAGKAEEEDLQDPISINGTETRKKYLKPGDRIVAGELRVEAWPDEADEAYRKAKRRKRKTSSNAAESQTKEASSDHGTGDAHDSVSPDAVAVSTAEPDVSNSDIELDLSALDERSESELGLKEESEAAAKNDDLMLKELSDQQAIQSQATLSVDSDDSRIDCEDGEELEVVELEEVEEVWEEESPLQEVGILDADPLAAPLGGLQEVVATPTGTEADGGTGAAAAPQSIGPRWYDATWIKVVGISLCILIPLVGLAIVIRESMPVEEELYGVAIAHYNEKSYDSAMSAFDAYLSAFPDGYRADQATILKGFAKLQGASRNGKDWVPALDMLDETLQRIGKRKHHPLVQSRLEDILPAATRQLLEQAQSSAVVDDAQKAELIRKARKCVDLGQMFLPESVRLEKGLVLLELEVILFEQDLSERTVIQDTIKRIDSSLNSGTAADVLAEYAKLLKRYPKVASETALNTLMNRFTKNNAIRIRPIRRGTPSQLVLEESSSKLSIIAIKVPQTGTLLGINQKDGTESWKKSVPPSSPSPLSVPDSRDWIVFGLKKDHITRLAPDGIERWTTNLPGVIQAPRIWRNRLSMVVDDVHHKVVDLTTGQLSLETTFTLPVVGSPTYDASQGRWLVAAESADLWSLSETGNTPMTFFLGHQIGEVVSPPVVDRSFILAGMQVDTARTQITVHRSRDLQRLQTLNLAGVIQGSLESTEDATIVGLRDGRLISIVPQSNQARPYAAGETLDFPHSAETAPRWRISESRLWVAAKSLYEYPMPPTAAPVRQVPLNGDAMSKPIVFRDAVFVIVMNPDGQFEASRYDLPLNAVKPRWSVRLPSPSVEPKASASEEPAE